MVTLLLIPSVLVTGTAVDSARIYASRSIVQDANQLAANSVLASYDALLQDLYGLYGIMATDSQLADMINKYIEISIYGQESRNMGLGTFQLTYGSNLQPGTITAAPNMNLGNTEVLRRQIEEYAKFRAPVILVTGILDKLESFKKVKKDADVIKQKMDIDKDLEKLGKSYQEMYDLIQEINGCREEQQKIVDGINAILTAIADPIVDKMINTARRWYYEDIDNDDEHYVNDDKRYYSYLCDNIKRLISGSGNIKIDNDWDKGHYEGEEENPRWVNGRFRGSRQISERSLEKWLEYGTERMGKFYPQKLDELVELCKKIDNDKEKLRKKVNELERKLNEEDGCSDQLKESLTSSSSSGYDGVSMMDYYRRLLEYNVTAMGEAMREYNTPQLEAMADLVDKDTFVWQEYLDGEAIEGSQIPLSKLKSLKSDPEYAIDAGDYPLLNLFAGPSLTNIKVPDDPHPLGVQVSSDPNPFKYFQSPQFASTKNPEFYDLLEQMWGAKKDGDKKKAKGVATKIFKVIQDMFLEIGNYEPEGAWKYEPSAGTGGDSGGAPLETNFGADGDWSKEDEGRDKTTDALNDSIITRLGDIGDDIANKGLLLIYDSEMFSNFTTNKKDDDTTEKSMSGIPFGTDVNYYYQSEMEYLYAGNLNNAQANLATVTGMLFLVRFVFNYIASFQISGVTSVVGQVRTALSFSGPFAFVISELVRVGFALGESVTDVSRLRSGHEVALFKTNNSNNWKFSISGLTATAEGLAEDFTVSKGDDDSDDIDRSVLDDDGSITLNYKNYLQIFMLFVSDTVLAERTQNLIQLNLTTKRNGFGSNDHIAMENAMTAATLEELSKAMTGFSLTTTMDLRMLFLSMRMAQEGVNGVVPPGTIPISVTDYRGY